MKSSSFSRQSIKFINHALENNGNMMNRLVKFPLESGGFVYIEVSEMEREGGLVKASSGLPDEVSETFESALNSLSPIANAIVSRLISVSNPPSEVGVEFGLTLKADAGLVITKVGAEANFKVSLKWTGERSKS
jgi:hypothetical protein